MGDRCYMTVRCRKVDAHIFEELGFRDDSDTQGRINETGIVVLVDEQANYAHSGDLPTNIPWTGRSEAGGSYGAVEWACDGNALKETPSGHDGGFVVEWDAIENNPRQHDIDEIRAFIAVEKTALKMFAEQQATP